MLRFQCNACNKTLKVPENLAGKKVCCPRCHEPTKAPEPAQEPASAPPVESLDDAPGFFSSMSNGLRLSLAAVVAAGALGLLVSALRPSHGLASLGMVVAAASFLGLLAMLYGHGTGCPSCGAWWSRWKVGSEVGEREVFERDGKAFGRSLTRTTFRCDRCGRSWSVAEAEEYPVSEQSQARRLSG